MKIALIGPVYPYKGGIAHYTALLAQELKKKHELFCYSYSMQYPKLLFKKEQRDYGNKSFAVEGAEFILHTANPFNWIRSAKKIRSAQPALLILQWWHPYFAPCYRALLRQLRGIPTAFICHNVLPHERFFLDSVLTKAVLRQADFCVVHSTQDAADLQKLLPRMPMRINPHPSYHAFRLRGIGRAQAREWLKLKQEAKVLLFFGLVRKYKGLDVLIDAAAECQKHIEDLRIVIAGDFGDKRDYYRKKIEESPARDCFCIRDAYIPDTEVENYFAAADLCVCPYLSATQSGIVQIAFGFELPVVATDVGGLPEAVSDARTGYIVPPQDAKALSAAILRFFSEDKAGQFRANIRAEQERFSWARMEETIMQLYEENCT